MSTLTAHRGTVNFLSEVSYDLQLKVNAPQGTAPSPLMLSTGSDNVIKIWDLKRMRSASEIMTSGSGLLTKAVWIGPAVMSCSNGGMVKLFQYSPTPPSGAGHEDNSALAGHASPVHDVSQQNATLSAFGDDSSVTAIQAGKAEWRCRDLACHSQACTDLLSTSQYVAVSSKSGQIFKWNRLQQ
jgi:WD40 repeat protein